jgi:hypothetical protein
VAVAQAKACLKKQASPEPVVAPVRRDVVEVNQDVTAGRSRQPQHRALTPCERMHADKMLSFEELEAPRHCVIAS